VSKGFKVFVTDDLVKESNETFNVILINVSNANLGGTGIGTVTIIDNDKKPRGPRITTSVVAEPREVRIRKSRE
jgi:hypothetical protein